MIKKVTERAEKEVATRLCDNVFSNGLYTRDDADIIFNKIDKYADFFIAYEKEEIAGYAAMYNNDYESKTAYITMIGVRVAFQRKHFGSKLIEECICSAQNNGMKKIRLEVLDINTKAKSFYIKHGFVYDGKCSEKSSYMILDI